MAGMENYFSPNTSCWIERIDYPTTGLFSYPQQSHALAVLCEIFKLAKWLTVALSIGLMLYGVIRLISGRRQTQMG